MLYKIRLPKEQEYLHWIVSLQHRVLANVCDPSTTAVNISVAWLVRTLHDVELKWVVRLSTVKDNINGNNKTLLDNLTVIASLPNPIKCSLLADFEHDLHFERAYHGYCGSYPFRGLQSLNGQPQEIIRAVRGAMECFYTPIFYRSTGYQITEKSGRIRHFDKDDYLQAYQQANPEVEVCPFCDGKDEALQIDHFIRKSEFPGLSCHPLNLVPICWHCNKGANKGQKRVYDIEQSDPVAEWLHPLLRAACGDFEIRLQDATGRIHPSLASNDATTQRRLNNFTRLIKLDNRWEREIRSKFKLVERYLDRMKQNLQRRPSKSELLDKLEELMELARDVERGIEPYTLLAEVYYREAYNQNPAIFDELWEYSQS